MPARLTSTPVSKLLAKMRRDGWSLEVLDAADQAYRGRTAEVRREAMFKLLVLLTQEGHPCTTNCSTTSTQASGEATSPAID